MRKKCLVVFLSVVFLFLGVSSVSAAIEDKFKDLELHTAKGEIEYLYNRNIIKGYPDGTFRPNNSVTRVQAISMIARALKLDLSSRPNPGFKDIPTDHYAYKEIAAVVDEGLYPKGEKLYPYEPMSRETMARMIANAFKLTGESQKTFVDVPKNYWAYQYITKLAANNITTGYPNNTFRPKSSLTRSQFALFLTRALNDDFKMYTYSSSKLQFSIQLPNYLKDKLIIEESTENSYGSFLRVSFYFKDNDILNKKLIVASLSRFSYKQWNEYFLKGDFSKVAQTKNWIYALQQPNESAYTQFPNLKNHPTVLSYKDSYYRLDDALKNSIVIQQ